jgi:ABC-type nitrate/sulfonate/bicarbonate transport system substrate-binding protein
LKPIWGKRYRPNDGLPSVVCGGYAFSADYVLQQIQTSGLDIKNGFHLGIVPFYLNDQYFVTAQDRSNALKDGTLDCLLTTFDLMALEDPGVLTGLINESAGGDALWARDLKSINELKGKRIAFEANGPSAFFVYDLLNTVQLGPNDVTLLPQPSQSDAIAVFNKGDADAVAGWEPVILDAERSGGTSLATSKEFRSILGGIVMSRDAVIKKRVAIQSFHNAWFQALKLHETDFGTAANAIAAWGNNAYLSVSVESAEDDLRTLLNGVAQASLSDNVRVFSDVPSLAQRLQQARGLWALNGHTVPSNDVAGLIDPEFVLVAGRLESADPQAVNTFVNSTFSLGRTRIPVQVGADVPSVATVLSDTVQLSQTVATLPCSRFDFLPNSRVLQFQSTTELKACAVDVLRQNVSLIVRVRGSSAWPGPRGATRQSDVESTAKARAQAVVDYLVSQGIDRERFVVEWTLPPVENRETLDIKRMAEDRFVEISLLASGL